MRVVVLGSGKLARLRASFLAADPRVSWLGIGSSRPEWAQSAAEASAASAAGSVESMLGSSPDAVIIASASQQHVEQICACLPLGVPLFCEKPITLGLEEAVEVVAEVRARGVELQVGFDRRCDPRLRELRSRIVAGDYGTLQSLTLTSHDRDPPSRDFAERCGGMFLDLHVHDFDLARWLTGSEVDQVFTVGGRRGPCEFLDELGDVDTTAIVMRMRDGLPVVIRGSRQDPSGYLMRTELVASTGAAEVGVERLADYRERFSDALRLEMSAFLDMAAGVSSNPCPGEECVEAMRIAIAAELSHSEHRAVSLDSVGVGLGDAASGVASHPGAA